MEMRDISLPRRINPIIAIMLSLMSNLDEREHTIYRICLKGIVSRDFVVCFLVSFDRSDISIHQERVLLLLKVRFRNEFFDFRVRPL
jgi:hypothetical protein